MKHHGLATFDRIALAGATAADDQRLDLESLPSAAPLREAPPSVPRWSRAFSEVLDRVPRVNGRLEPKERRAAQEALSTLVDAEVEALFGKGGGEERWNERFAWTGRRWPEIEPLGVQLAASWLCCYLAEAAEQRFNAFGRLFPRNMSLPTESQLQLLADHMHEGFANPDAGIPAGFIFFGQFIDHDVTLDAITGLGETGVTVEDVINLRSPSFDLDSVYRDGPEASPHLYDQTREHEGYLLIEQKGHDLPRNSQGRALLGDPRNDENLFVSQLHLQFLLFHNAVLRMVHGGGVDVAFGRLPDESDFEFARRLVRWHYQWIAVNEYLPLIVHGKPLDAAHAITGVPQGAGTVPSLLPDFNVAAAHLSSLGFTGCCGRVHDGPKMPVEFSGAAFRFAHSQVPSRFDINDERQNIPLFTPKPPAPGAFNPATDTVSWERFFVIDGSTPQAARPIDTFVTAQLFALPFAPSAPSLPLRNLVRSALVYALPTGETARTTLGLDTASQMSPAALAKTAAAGLTDATPLWFYCLGEAEDNGGQLGAVGGLIVAWTFLQMLRCDPHSYVNAATPWQPVLLPSEPGKFEMADLIRIADGERIDAFGS
ncbi:MAG: peroxidase family protein [Myxococcota bacterium]